MIIIVGAGITGLSAAFELATRGIPFQILEASQRPGGLIRTEQVDGFTIEGGGRLRARAETGGARAV